MAQVTLYVDDETMARMRVAAQASGLSLSAWVAGVIRDRTRSEWPPEVARLAGAWRDMPLAEELRAEQPEDSPREAV